MHREQLEAEAERLIRENGTRDPFKIAAAVGAEVRFKELGSLKGMYLCIGSTRFIVINAALSEAKRREVCAHELGHDCFHREQAQNAALHEYARATGGDRTEYEANLFAAALLIADEDILEYAEDSPEQLAQALSVDGNLLAFKLHLMRRRGYPCLMLSYRSDYLK